MIERLISRDSLVEALAALEQANHDESAAVRNLEFHISGTPPKPAGPVNGARRSALERQLAGHRAVRERQNVALLELRRAFAAYPPAPVSCAGCARPLLVAADTDPTATAAWCVKCGGTASPLPHGGAS